VSNTLGVAILLRFKKDKKKCMIKNYFAIAVRNLFKNPLFSVINITGLALGMAGAGILLLNIQYEFSVDQFHEKKDRVFKVYNKAVLNGRLQCYDATVAPLGPVLKNDFPSIKQMTRVAATGKLFNYKDKKLQAGGYYADEAFLNMFSFPLLSGNTQTALKDKHAIILTQQLAKKIFGDEDPVNKVINLDSADNVTVMGVLKDIPLNSSLKFDYLLPWRDNNYKWDNFFANTYVELGSAGDVSGVNNQISNVISRHSKNEEGVQIFLHPVSKMHMQHHFDEKGRPETERNIYFLYVLVVVMLLIGCINFMNLSTARSGKRGKEVGVRKIMGAAKGSLIIQFITESTLIACIAGGIALLLVQLAWPVFSIMAKIPANIPWQSPGFWLSVLAFIFFTGLLAGSYPAFYLSSFKAVKVLKGVFNNKSALITPRRILVVVQFIIAISLMNLAIIFRKQVNFTENRDPGFMKAGLVFHPITKDLRRNYEVVQQELMNTGMVADVCRSNMSLTRAFVWISGYEWAGGQNSKSINFSVFTTTGNFVNTNGLTLLKGRDIDYNAFHTDTASCVINERAAKELGFTNPVGQIIKDEDFNWKIVGVVKDFYQSDPSELAKPAMIQFGKGDGIINIRMKAGSTSLQNIRTIEEILKRNNPGYITELQFADVDVANSYKQRKNVSGLINMFTFIAILIACMGLLGLTVYMTELRKREVGIRKVLGASVTKVTTLLTTEFIKLVAIAVIIASPLAWLFMNSFLQQFSYRTNLSWWILPASGAVALVIAIATISFQAIKAAIANPAKTLRSE
jgi:ABC-type antimicrobial peptide transport system permease subunit